MGFRKALPYIAVYLVAALSIPMFFASAWLKPVPELRDLYDGPQSFSGDRAYSLLETLVTLHPNRDVGGAGARLSSEWVLQRFESLGLDAEIEAFDALVRDTTVRPDRVFASPITALTYTVPGYNVVAKSPGKSDEVILIGAHRDTYSTIQGAEDNASGTACMLELASLLTSEEHHYTYLFVSFDGEEVGLRGSTHFAETHANLDLRLAISLDMTGFADADTVGFYPFVSSRGASPLWTQALARSICADMGLHPYWFQGLASSPYDTAFTRFRQARLQRTTVYVPTDSGPFVDRNLPSIGVMAGLTGETFFAGGNSQREIHTDGDTLQNVSAATLSMVGSFVERYVKSMELHARPGAEPNALSGEFSSNLYLITGDELLGALPMTAFAWTVPTLAAALALASWFGAGAARRGMLRFVAKEAILLGAIGVASFASAYVAGNPQLFLHYSLSSVHLSWMLATLVSTGFICYLRFRALSSRGGRFHGGGLRNQAGSQAGGQPGSQHGNQSDAGYADKSRATSIDKAPSSRFQCECARQKALLTWMYAAIAGALVIAGNPFSAMWSMLFPVFFLGRVDYRRAESRVLFGLAALIWTVRFVGSRNTLLQYVFYPPTMRMIASSALGTAAWMASVVYILVVPLREAR